MRARTSSTALCVAVFTQMIGVGLIVALLPGRVILISHSTEYVGYLASAFAVSFVAMQLPVGHLGDRYGYRLFLVAGYIISCLAGLLYFKTQSVAGILVGRFLQGISEVPLWALAPALLSLLYPDTKGEAIGKYNASLHLGLTAGSLASVYAYSAWKCNEAFLFYAATGAISALIILVFVKDPVRENSGEPLSKVSFSGVFNAITKIGNPAVLAGVCLYGGAYGAFVTVIPGILLKEMSLGQSVVAIFFAQFYIAVSISQVLGGKMTDRKGPVSVITTGLLLVAAGLFSFVWVEGLSTLVFLFVASFGLGMFCVSSMVLLNQAAPYYLKGSISGVFCLLWGIGYFILPAAMAQLGQILDYHVLFALLASAAMVEAVFVSRKKPANRGKA